MPYEEFENTLGEKLIERGIDAWYVIGSTSFYKGRRYPQNIMVVYCDGDKKKSVAGVFQNVCKVMGITMQQEKFAYELNGYYVCFMKGFLRIGYGRNEMALKKELGQGVICPVCGKYIFEFDFDICEVCEWENDPLQNENHDYAGGANKMSVNEARKVYKQGKKAE